LWADRLLLWAPHGGRELVVWRNECGAGQSAVHSLHKTVTFPLSGLCFLMIVSVAPSKKKKNVEVPLMKPINGNFTIGTTVHMAT
jgi:hypothetical protein